MRRNSKCPLPHRGQEGVKSRFGSYFPGSIPGQDERTHWYMRFAVGSTRTWQSTGSLKAPRDMMTAAVLPDERVLVAGGQTYFGNRWWHCETTEIYDPATGKFSKGKNMTRQRAAFSLATLRNGQLLAVGGDAWFPPDGLDAFEGTIRTSIWRNRCTGRLRGQVGHRSRPSHPASAT